MDKKLIEYLEEMNEQEERILRENRPVLSYYTKGEGSTVVDAGITMRPMTLIDLLKQPRFVPLPRHTHNYMELVYMCSGSTTHVINEETQITLQEGELLFLQQGTSHSVSAAGYHDIAVRFMIRPAFLHARGQEPSGKYDADASEPAKEQPADPSGYHGSAASGVVRADL